uniref:Uncharacterized protein n=1 Tax=Capra hircus TaxID=9925 RepID=A0A452FJJ7_CAPHI
MTPTATVCFMSRTAKRPRTTINLLLQLSKLASNVSCVTIQHRCVSSTDLAWMVQNNHLSCEASSFHGWVIFAVTSHIATTDIFDRHVLDTEAHSVPRKGFTQCFTVHFYRLHLRCYVDWSKGDHHAGSESTSLHTTHRDGTNTTNFIDILERQRKGLSVGRVGGRMQSRASSRVVPLALPSLRVTFHPLNHGILALGSSMLSPFQPEIGTNATVSGL